MDNRYLYVALMLVALNTGLSMFYLPKDSLKEMFVTRPWKANDDCLIQYERKVVSILAHIMAEQAAKDRCAIETTPSIKYLRLAKQILFIIESHDFGNEVQERLPVLQSTPSLMTQMSLTTSESDPSRGLLMTQSSRRSCTRD